jgi:hypothetical protein
VARHVGAGLRRDPGGVRRGGAIVAGLALTAGGYARGRVQRALHARGG